MRRTPTIELLDTDAGTGAEVAASFQDLRWFNRWFGGIRTAKRLIGTASKGRPELSLLEVASGDGFIAHELKQQFGGSGLRMKVTLLDRAATHLPKNGFSRVTADALALPFEDATFDFVSSSLFAHHLSPEEVVAFVREALRVCRVAVLISDLVRSRIHLAAALVGIPFYRSRITRNDAPASVRQAYTVTEMREMLEKTGALDVEIWAQYFFRMGAIAWKGPRESR